MTSSCVQRLPLPAADPGVFEEGSEALSLDPLGFSPLKGVSGITYSYYCFLETRGLCLPCLHESLGPSLSNAVPLRLPVWV